MYQCALFDMDGTLVDSYEAICHAYEWTMKKMEMEFGGAAFVRRAIGAPLPLVFRELCKMDETQIARAVTFYQIYYKEREKEEVTACAGIEETLQRLRASGMHLGVITFSDEIFARTMLERLGLLTYFEIVCGAKGDRVQTKAQMLQSCLRTLEILPEEAVFVGDSEYDARGAKQAGVDFLAATYGYGLYDPAPDHKVEARAFVSTAAEIGQWICSQGR